MTYDQWRETMAMIRWASDSDVYVYESFNGYVVHIAGARWKFSEEYPCPVLGDYINTGRLSEYNKDCTEAYEHAELIDIEMEEAGRTFSFENLISVRSLLLTLKEEGFMIPQYGLDRIQQEIERTYDNRKSDKNPE